MTDIVIIGAGVMGLSVAYQIALRSKLKIKVIEKGTQVGEGSTGASSAVCRFRYSLDEMVLLARDGINTYRHWPEFTRLTSQIAQYHNDGALWLPGKDLAWAQREHTRMQALGVRTEVLDDQEVQKRFPDLSVCPIAPDLVTGEPHQCAGGGSHYYEVDGGYIDPVAVCEDLLSACRREGVEVCFNQCVAKISVPNSKVASVEFSGGEKLSVPTVVNAAGPWCNHLYVSAGLQFPWNLEPVRAQILYLDTPAELVGKIPVCEDFSGSIYLRTQNRGQQIVVGSLKAEDEEELVSNPNEFNRFADDAFLHPVLHALHHRLPGLPYRGKVRGYSGLYTMNRQDVHPIVGETAVSGLYAMNGFSGHGFKLAPAIGSLLAQQITGSQIEGDTQIPWDFLSVERTPIEISQKSVLA